MAGKIIDGSMRTVRAFGAIGLAGAILLASPAVRADDDIPAYDPCTDGLRTAASVTFSDQVIGVGSIMYQTVYTERDWAGDLVGICLDARGAETPCQCEDGEGALTDCAEFMPGFPEIKWSADTLAWNTDTALNKDPEDGWWNRRRVITYSPRADVGVAFRYDALGDEQRRWLRYDPDLVAYIRGDRSMEPERFRARSSYYGDFINSVPVSYGSVILAAANDGMLHVFDERTGHEYFSYVPNSVLSRWERGTGDNGSREEHLAVLSDADYQDKHRSLVDGTVTVAYLEDHATTLVAGSLGRGGKGIYGLNIFGLREMADPEERAADIVMWEYPDPDGDRLQAENGRLVEIGSGLDESADVYDDAVTALAEDPYLGVVHGSPRIVRLPHPEAPGYKWAVVFANGYLSHNQTPVLYILDAYDGSVLKRIFTTKSEDSDRSDLAGACPGELGCNGLSTPELVDYDNDGIIDYGYGGDLAGNLWKFDFTLGDIYGPDGYIASFHDGGDLDGNGRPAPRPLIAAADRLGNPQPITAKPTVTRPCTVSGDGLMVLFGTGMPADIAADITADTQVQSVYGIWDWQEAWRADSGYGIEPEAAFYGTIVSTGIDSGVRFLSNLGNVLSTQQASHIGILEQNQLLFAGIRFYDETHPGAGGIREIIADPDDYSGYDQVVRTMTGHQINWVSPAEIQNGLDAAGHVGWVFDLPLQGEHLVGEPKVLDGVLYYATSLGPASSCDADTMQTMIMAHDSCSGAGTTDIVFDLNGDDWLNSKDGVGRYEDLIAGQDSLEQAAGILYPGAGGGPSVISSRGRDILFTPGAVSADMIDLNEAGGNLAEHRPGVEQQTVRGKNLGMSFWRELF